jgi:hypothetical protein
VEAMASSTSKKCSQFFLHSVITFKIWKRFKIIGKGEKIFRKMFIIKNPGAPFLGALARRLLVAELIPL